MSNVLDVIVIGAGQSGLATGYHLQKAGLSFVILEAGTEIGGSWLHYYDSLYLFSPARYSSLPGFKFPGDPDRYPSRQEVIVYLQQYAWRFQLPVMTQTHVTGVKREGEQFIVETEKRPFYAHSLIIAAGAFNQPSMPDLPGQAQFSGEVLHAFHYQNPERFQGKRVVVVGAGNSAVQIAADLAPHAHVTLASLHPVRWRPQHIWGLDIHFWLRVTGLDTKPGKPPQSWRRAVIDSGNYQTALETKQFDWQPMFQAFHSTGVLWSDGQTETVDTVIYATGYRPTYPFLAKLGISEVIHQNGISQQIVGLYFVGLAFQRNHASATLRGAGPDAAYVVRHVEAQLRSSRRYQLWQGINGRFFAPLRQLYCQQFCQSASLK